MLSKYRRLVFLQVICLLILPGLAVGAETKKIVFISGGQSHGYGSHEHYAGCMLLARCMKETMPNVETTVHKHRWPESATAFDDVDAVVLFADGGAGNPILRHLDQVDDLVKRGVGLACLHYAVQVPKGESGDMFKRWIGGHFELHWSVNPHWDAKFQSYPNHPIARGLKPFTIGDEWYYHMRFKDDMQGVTPILTATPPDDTRKRPDGPYSGNPVVRSRLGMSEHLAWAVQREDGGRGFGFTGGHWHWNWANDNFRKVVLNGIAWTAHIDIPSDGIRSKTPSWKELEQNQDFPVPDKFNSQRWKKQIELWKRSSQ